MVDKYIDRDETQIYGPYASKMIRERVVGLIPELDTGLLFFADQIDAATLGMKAALETTHSVDAGRRAGSTTRQSVLEQGRDLLMRFSRHLDAHPKGAIDRRVFFAQDGTASGVPRGASQVLLALSRIGEQFEREDSPVRDRTSWLAELSSTMNALASAIGHSADMRTDRRHATPVIEATRLAWLNTYYSARSVVESILRFTGKLDLLPTIFQDLTVPSGTKKAVLVEPPAEPADPGSVVTR